MKIIWRDRPFSGDLVYQTTFQRLRLKVEAGEVTAKVVETLSGEEKLLINGKECHSLVYEIEFNVRNPLQVTIRTDEGVLFAGRVLPRRENEN